MDFPFLLLAFLVSVGLLIVSLIFLSRLLSGVLKLHEIHKEAVQMRELLARIAGVESRQEVEASEAATRASLDASVSPAFERARVPE
jgi:hypothetical protein